MVESVLVPNLVRAITIALLALTIGATAVVFRLYRKASVMAPRSAGLLPWHVSAVSLGVLILQGTLAWAMIEQVGREATVASVIRICLYGLGSAIILTALFIMSTLQERRVRFARSGCTTTRVERDEKLSVDYDEDAP